MDGEYLDSGPRDRASIARKAADARWEKHRARAKGKADEFRASSTPPDPTADDQSGFANIDYDKTLGLPNSWLEAQQREKVIGEQTLNLARDVDLEKSRIALEKERGRLLSVDDVEAREERADEVYQRHLSGVLDLVATLVPPDQINAARTKASEWIAERQRLIAEELGTVDA
jgi:hypothetical protein